MFTEEDQKEMEHLGMQMIKLNASTDEMVEYGKYFNLIATCKYCSTYIPSHTKENIYSHFSELRGSLLLGMVLYQTYFHIDHILYSYIQWSHKKPFVLTSLPFGNNCTLHLQRDASDS